MRRYSTTFEVSKEIRITLVAIMSVLSELSYKKIQNNIL